MRAAVFICAFALFGCTESVSTTPLAELHNLKPDSYAFAPLADDAPPLEHFAQIAVAEQMNAHGFKISDTPAYRVEIALSSRPAKIGLYGADQDATDHSRTDLPPGQAFHGVCTPVAVRLTVQITARQSGAMVALMRSGRVRCSENVEQSLPGLAAAAVAQITR